MDLSGRLSDRAPLVLRAFWVEGGGCRHVCEELGGVLCDDIHFGDGVAWMYEADCVTMS